MSRSLFVISDDLLALAALLTDLGGDVSEADAEGTIEAGRLACQPLAGVAEDFRRLLGAAAVRPARSKASSRNKMACVLMGRCPAAAAAFRFAMIFLGIRNVRRSYSAASVLGRGIA